jgi:DNA-directed RNA polymerase specialized sigma24 family protein
MSPASSVLPNEPTLLATHAQDVSLPEEVREQARRALAPVILHIAWKVAAKARQPGRDLLDEAVSHVLHRLDRFSVASGCFVPWCRRVLTNRLTDLVRRAGVRRAEVLHAEEREDPSADASLRAFEVAADLAAPFSAADLARVCDWTQEDRVVLLSLGLLWRKVPAEVWRRTVTACGLEPPFPPPGFGEGDTREERGRVLARALGWTRNRVSQRLSRGRRLLRALEFVRDIE